MSTKMLGEAFKIIDNIWTSSTFRRRWHALEMKLKYVHESQTFVVLYMNTHSLQCATCNNEDFMQILLDSLHLSEIKRFI